MLNSRVEREKLVNKRTELLPDITTMPKIEKVEFEVPTKPTHRYDDKNPLPRSMKYINAEGRDNIEKLTAKVNIFDADYLN